MHVLDDLTSKTRPVTISVMVCMALHPDGVMCWMLSCMHWHALHACHIHDSHSQRMHIEPWHSTYVSHCLMGCMHVRFLVGHWNACMRACMATHICMEILIGGGEHAVPDVSPFHAHAPHI